MAPRPGHRDPGAALTAGEGPLVTALCGGVGAARFLSGLVDVVDPHRVVAVVNTGDDALLHGLHVSPDLDTVTYTLAGAISRERGWGLEGETWTTMEALARYPSRLSWFGLGDRDLATHLFRTQRLADGASLSTVTGEITAAWGVQVSVVPVTDDRVETLMDVEDEGEISFQDYFVRRAHDVVVRGVRFRGADAARPAPGVLDAVATAGVVVICPSNPIVSIGPLLAVPGVREVVTASRDRVVAVSPIVAGAALKGPAGRLLAEQGHEVSVVGVARLYAPLAATLVVDEADAALAPAVESAGMRCLVTPTVMRGPEEAAALARAVVDAA
ncbi:MAG TPA: 2-phospho-L-lactate transferase [Acidimicrobiales bacterium]|nr:2-phospho-L-lactate transferase [Acidimicrobiales bacterium]